MAIPVLLWGAAAALAATGIVKGAAALSDIDDAKEIGERAERRYKRRKRELNSTKDETNLAFEELGQFKVDIFNNQIRHIVQVLNNTSNKHAKSELSGFNSTFDIAELKEMETMVQTSLELSTNLGSSAITGALAGFGVYGAVPMLATASTGTAISTLSGAAATNATLAWLGGGSLAAGGFGMAGGMVALGGIVAGPALAIGGFMLASKAEEALTEARAYRAEIDEAIDEMDLITEGLEGLKENAREIRHTLEEMVKRFEKVRVDHADHPDFHTMLVIGKAIKNLLNTPIMEEDGSPVANIRHQCEGYLNIELGTV
ncbi:TPA: hypothetical protein ACFN7P_001199 [Neisseria meningitidis]|uniref:hypothetical protein n=1 Tax=Neisseria TaxID=482 RepID=UPI0001D9D6C2|nr:MULTISPECIES: hypothetical protein [Neisseria]EFH21916.1 hypothetical protein NEIPOLOT_02352 [Neisseria polysaccharea ATCC 43768]MBG9085244.1 hypothetical protein [Neisseria meningitidis]MBG9095379.1 hypothetical protein [Neisseria meningitidis]MBG9145596.1 hypothetical protein [Neisseria meningitidis]MBG9156107.1 hypothetical protein [Neisseria meningitidis]